MNFNSIIKTQAKISNLNATDNVLTNRLNFNNEKIRINKMKT